MTKNAIQTRLGDPLRSGSRIVMGSDVSRSTPPTWTGDTHPVPPAKSRMIFELATQADDSGIRRLLRENPMPGLISISLEREPDYFTEANAFHHDQRSGFQTIVAREGGRVVCVGSCAIRQRFVNGRPARVGYLGGLRLDTAYAGRFDVLRRGYECFRELQTAAPAEFYFTSIAADNERARQFLERGISGMPRYEFLGEFVTLIISASANSGASPQRVLGLPEAGRPNGNNLVPEECITFVNQQNSGSQFAPRWSARDLETLSRLGFNPQDVCFAQNCDRLAAMAALWDQRSFKQTVIQAYKPWLAFSRFAFNGLARLTGYPCLPAAGDTLGGAFISLVASLPDQAGALVDVISSLKVMASARGIRCLVLGFGATDPRLGVVRARLRCREYRSRIYVVHWPGIGAGAAELDGRPLAPEVSLL